jgi:hypothetical protein
MTHRSHLGRLRVSPTDALKISVVNDACRSLQTLPHMTPECPPPEALKTSTRKAAETASPPGAAK